jgi:hypothetical protein
MRQLENDIDVENIKRITGHEHTKTLEGYIAYMNSQHVLNNPKIKWVE